MENIRYQAVKSFTQARFAARPRIYKGEEFPVLRWFIPWRLMVRESIQRWGGDFRGMLALRRAFRKDGLI